MLLNLAKSHLLENLADYAMKKKENIVFLVKKLEWNIERNSEHHWIFLVFNLFR